MSSYVTYKKGIHRVWRKDTHRCHVSPSQEKVLSPAACIHSRHLLFVLFPTESSASLLLPFLILQPLGEVNTIKCHTNEQEREANNFLNIPIFVTTESVVER